MKKNRLGSFMCSWELIFCDFPPPPPQSNNSANLWLLQFLLLAMCQRPFVTQSKQYQPRWSEWNMLNWRCILPSTALHVKTYCCCEWGGRLGVLFSRTDSLFLSSYSFFLRHHLGYVFLLLSPSFISFAFKTCLPNSPLLCFLPKGFCQDL